MNNKFDWDRFYDELEEGDPKKFPFWMFLVHEMVLLIEKIVAGFALAFIISLVLFSATGILWKYWDTHPNLPIKTFCKAYQNNE